MAVTTTYEFEFVPPPNFSANTDTAGSQRQSSVVGVDGGGYALVYRSEDGGNIRPRLDIYPTPSGTPIAVDLTATGYSTLTGAPVIAKTPGGDISVMWRTGAGEGSKFVHVIVNPAGQIVDTDVEDFAQFQVAQAVLSANGVEGYLVTNGAAAGHVRGGIYSQFDGTGSQISAVTLSGGATSDRFAMAYVDGNGEIRVQVRTFAGVEISNNPIATSADGSDPRIVALHDGGFAVVFDDASLNDTVDDGIGVVLFDESGNAGPLTKFDTLSGLEAGNPRMIVLETGHLVPTYSLFGVQYASLLEPDGARAVVTGGVAMPSTDSVGVAALDGGRFVMTSSSSFSTDIAARVVDTIRRSVGDGANDVMTGDGLRDVMDGGGGNDTLDGRGGSDVLKGGLGNDTYVLGAEASGIDEVNDSAGIDTITSTIDRSLAFADYSEIENLTLLGSARFGTGNGLANVITGNASANVLDGGAGRDKLIGGGGIDTLIGGRDSDIFYVDRTIDRAVELAGGGTADHVYFTGTGSQLYTLAANVELLTLLGTANTRGTGNRLANTITGNSGRNTLDGGVGNDVLNGGNGNDILIGGLGRDTLTGGLHNDTFKFTNTTHSRGSTMDIITDFDDRGRGNDRIDVSALFGPRMKYIHDDAFDGRGQVRIMDIAGPDVIVEVNTGGSLAADFAIRLKGTALREMAANDFIL